MAKGNLHQDEAQHLAKRMIASVRRSKEKRQMELSTEKSGTIRS